MSSLNSLDTSRLIYGFNKISILKPSCAGVLTSTEAEILDTALCSQTDELDVVGDRGRPLPCRQQHKRAKSGMFTYIEVVSTHYNI